MQTPNSTLFTDFLEKTGKHWPYVYYESCTVIKFIVHIRLHELEAETSVYAKEKELLELSLKVKGEEHIAKEEYIASLEKELRYLRAKYTELEVEGDIKLGNGMKEFKYVFYMVWYCICYTYNVYVWLVWLSSTYV